MIISRIYDVAKLISSKRPNSPLFVVRRRQTEREREGERTSPEHAGPRRAAAMEGGDRRSTIDDLRRQLCRRRRFGVGVDTLIGLVWKSGRVIGSGMAHRLKPVEMA